MGNTFMDAHVHLDNLCHTDLETMRLTGIREVVSPVVFDFIEPVRAQTIADLWDSMIDCQLPRLADYDMRGWAMIGIAAISIPRVPDALLRLLPQYLKKPSVVVIGEIGFQPGWINCPDVGKQEYVYRAQLEIARECNAVVDVHTPGAPDKKREYTERSLRLAAEVGLDMAKVVIDHCSADNLAMVLEAGAQAAISVQPWRGLGPDDAAKLVRQHEDQARRIWVNSDYCILPSDAAAVARTALALSRAGVAEAIIRDICGDNARRFYGLL